MTALPSRAAFGFTLGLAVLALVLVLEQGANAAPGGVLAYQKISDTQGGFTGLLAAGDALGSSAVSLGDLDGDGISDVAVGSPGDDDGESVAGAVWILFLNDDGTLKSEQKISETQGEFTGNLDSLDSFGRSLAPLGDLNGDGVNDLAVGANWDDDGGLNRGAVWILFLENDGTVKSHQKISDTAGGFTGLLDDSEWLGSSIAFLGDLDGDTVGDIVVGAPLDDDGGSNTGALWVLFLNATGTVKSHQKISASQGGFTGALQNADRFGHAATDLGDLDGDGVVDIAVGTPEDNDNGIWRGSVWVIFLNSNGTVKGHQKISDTDGGFTGTLLDEGRFGHSVAGLGDLNGDGVRDLAVGADWDDDGGDRRGAAWVLFLDSEGSVQGHQKISSSQGGFGGTLDDLDSFGSSVGSLGDLDGDGAPDLAVGARADDDGSNDTGALWVLFLSSGCGDGVLALGEECDDSNTAGGDCCSATCQFETGPGTPDCCVSGFCNVTAACGAVCFSTGTCQLGGVTGDKCLCAQ